MKELHYSTEFSQSGVSLTSVLVALALFGFAGMRLADMADMSLSVVRKSQQMVFTTNLLNWVQTHGAKQAAIAHSANFTEALKMCYVDGVCSIGTSADFALYAVNGTQAISGTRQNPVLYSMAGKRCTSGQVGCKLRAWSSFVPRCYDPTTCTQPDYLAITTEVADSSTSIGRTTNVIVLKGFLGSQSNQVCNPDQPVSSQSIVVGFATGGLLCGM